MHQQQLQEQTIEEVSKILLKYDSVAAFSLGGSHAIGDNTAFSDIDFTVIFKTDERENVKEIFDEIATSKPTLSTLYLLFGDECLILFDNGVRLDIRMVKPSEYANGLVKKVKILYDPQGIIKNRFEASAEIEHEANKPKWNEAEGVYIDWYFWMFRQTYCYALQSELKPEKSFDKLYAAQTSLASIRKGLLDMLYFVNGKRDYVNNIDAQIAQKVAMSFVPFNVTETLSATRQLIELYTDVAKRYAEKEEVEFPEGKITKLLALLNEFDNERAK